MDAEVRHYVEFWSYVGDQLASTVLPKAQAQEVRYSWAILKQSFELEPTGVLRQALRQALIQNGIDWPDKVAAPLYKELGWNV